MSFRKVFFFPISSILSCGFFFKAHMLSCFSHFRLFATLWIVTHQVPLSMGFSRQEYWIGLSCPLPGDLPDPEVKPTSLIPPALASRFFTTSTTWKGPQLQRSFPKKLEVQASLWAPQPRHPSLESNVLRGLNFQL